MKIALCQINTTVGAFNYNRDKILNYYSKAIKLNADIVVYPFGSLELQAITNIDMQNINKLIANWILVLSPLLLPSFLYPQYLQYTSNFISFPHFPHFIIPPKTQVILYCTLC